MSMLKIHTSDRNNAKEHRKVIKGSDLDRKRPKFKRYGDAFTYPYSKKRQIQATFGQLNWTGRTWRIDRNNKKLPSKKQVRDGLVKEAET